MTSNRSGSSTRTGKAKELCHLAMGDGVGPRRPRHSPEQSISHPLASGSERQFFFQLIASDSAERGGLRAMIEAMTHQGSGVLDRRVRPMIALLVDRVVRRDFGER